MSKRPDKKPTSRLRRPVQETAALTDRERALLTWVRQNGPLSRSALIRISGLSGPAVFRSTEELAQRGYLRIGEPVVEGRGQPSSEVSLAPDAVLTVGLSVMTDFAEAALMDFTGRIRAVQEVSAPGMERAAVLANTLAFLDEACRRASIDRNAVYGMGVAVAGFFTGDDGVLNTANELEDWALVDLVAEIEAATDIPAIVENIANAAAIGENLLGVGAQWRSFAYLNIASGFGGGLILDGQPWRGASGNAGEFAGMIKAMGLAVPNLDSFRAHLTKAGVKTSGVRDLVERYNDSWPGVAEWIEEAGRTLRTFAIAADYVLDVEAFVIGGRLPPPLAQRLAKAAAIDREDRQRSARRGRPLPSPTVVAAELSAQSAVIGAATLPLAKTFFTSVSSPGAKILD